MEKLCVVCETPFPVLRRSRRDNRYCSGRCRMRDWRAAQRAAHTGVCGTCGVATPYPHKFCSRTCAAVAARRGLTVTTYSCAFCGRPVERAANDARRQRYCSRACALRDRVGTIPVPTIDPAFGHWLAGLIDGEGSFEIVVGQYGASVRFQITLRSDDRPVLETIRATLGFGKLYDSAPKRLKKHGGERVNPCSMYFCNSTRECDALRAVLVQFPLRSKKARDCVIWGEAVERLMAGDANAATFIALNTRLKAIRTYLPSVA